MTAISMRAAGRKGVIGAILAGGITAATCDFIAAMLIYSLPADMVGKAVARGWFGRDAMQGGLDVAAIGAASHYVILIVAAAIFVLTSLRFPILRRQALVTGPLFGICIYLVMHFVVLPLSALHTISNPQGLQLVEEVLGHMFVIGLPIALWARQFLGRA